MANATEAAMVSSSRPTAPPTVLNITESIKEAEKAEEEHEFDAISALLLNLVIIGCLLLAYFVKKFRIYSLPESAGALMVGMVIGGIVRLTTEDLTLFEFVSCPLFVTDCHGMESMLPPALRRTKPCFLYYYFTSVARGVLFLFITTHHIRSWLFVGSKRVL